jgi:hypothetical protein
MTSKTGRRLTLTDLAQLSEILGALAVVLSLIYVGVQVQQNTQAIEISAAQQSLDAYRQAQVALMEEPSMAEAMDKAYSGGELSSVEALQVDTYVHFIFSNWESAFLNHRKGLLDNEIWAGWERYYKHLMTFEVFSRTWIDNPVDGYTRSFTNYINDSVMPGIPRKRQSS